MNALVLGVIAVLCAVALHVEWSRRLRGLEERIKKLEAAQQKRMNYDTVEALENAKAAFILMDEEINALNRTKDNFEFWFDAARNGKKKK